MSWKRGLLAALAVCALLGGSAGCGAGDGQGRRDRVSASPVGKVLDETDEKGRHYREVDKKDAPEVAIEVQPDRDDGWDVRLTVRHFLFSPAGAQPRVTAGRGVAVLSVDGRTVATLRGGAHHLAAGLVPRGTHHVTARLYADDRTAWAVGGKPVQSTADITASAPTHATTTAPARTSGPAPTTRRAPSLTPAATPAPPLAPAPSTGGSTATAPADRAGAPDPGGKAS